MYLKYSTFFVIINYVIERIKNSRIIKNKGEIHMKTKNAVKPSMGGVY